jgi:hypothetical protein
MERYLKFLLSYDLGAPLPPDRKYKYLSGTLIKKKIKFSSYKEIQSEAVAKSYTRKGFLIYEEM